MSSAGTLEQARASHALERDIRTDRQVIEEPGVAAWATGVRQAGASRKLDDTTTCGCRRIDCLLNGRGIIGLAVTPGPEVRDAEG